MPPAARGFSIQADDMQVVDLGTEFGLSVSPNGTDVQVFDGEVELHAPDQEDRRVTAGNALARSTGGPFNASRVTPERFLNIADLETRDVSNVVRRWPRGIPVARDLLGVLEREYWVENRLIRQARWPSAPAAFFHEPKFFNSSRAKKNHVTVRWSPPRCPNRRKAGARYR